MTATDTFTGRTLEFWRAYKAAGGRYVVTRGGEVGMLSRVTSANVFVRIDDRVSPRHPGDLDLANPNAIRYIPEQLR